MTYLPQNNLKLNDYSTFRQPLLSTNGELLVSGQVENDIDICPINNTISKVYDFTYTDDPGHQSNVSVSNNTVNATTISADFRLTSKDVLKYNRGHDSRMEFMLAFKQTTAVGQCKVGLTNTLSNIYLGCANSVLYFNYTRNSISGSTTTIAQGSFNFNGNSEYSSKFTSLFSPIVQNLYAIHLNGNGVVYLEWYCKGYGWVILHALNMTDDANSSFLSNNFFFFLDVAAFVGSNSMYFSYAVGKSFLSVVPSRFSSFATGGSQTITTTNTGTAAIGNPVLSLRCNTTLNGLANPGYAILESIFCHVLSGNTCVVQIVRNSSLIGTNSGVFNAAQNVYPNENFVSVQDNSSATGVTFFSAPFLLYSYMASVDSNFSIVKTPRIKFSAGDIITICAKTFAGTSVAWFGANWNEVV